MIFPPKFSILDVQISELTLDKAYHFICEMIETGTKGYICVAPVATIMDAQDDSKYRDIVNNAVMVTPDGMPVVKLAHWKGLVHVQRCYGPDLMELACGLGQKKDIKHYFYGGTPDVLKTLKEKLVSVNPQINIAGMYSPDFLKVGEIEKQEVIDQINTCQPDILWVGLGSPKQDYWMANHRDKFNVPVIIGVGAAFDFIAGIKPQAPSWMQKCCLEWLFRLCSEPKRLWKRYLIGNPRFVFLILKRLIINRSIG